MLWPRSSSSTTFRLALASPGMYTCVVAYTCWADQTDPVDLTANLLQ